MFALLDTLALSDVGPFGWNEPTWVALGATVGALAAGATAWMAILTRSLAKRTHDVALETATLAQETRTLATASVEQMLQAERHHKDTLTPLVAIQVKARISRRWQDKVAVSLAGVIQNAGSGPAINVDVHVQPGTFVVRDFTINMIAAETEVPFEREIIYDASTTLEMLPYNAMVAFDDLFGQRGAVFQASHSDLAEDCVIQQLIRPGVSTMEQLKEIAIGRHFSL